MKFVYCKTFVLCNQHFFHKPFDLCKFTQTVTSPKNSFGVTDLLHRPKHQPKNSFGVKHRPKSLCTQFCSIQDSSLLYKAKRRSNEPGVILICQTDKVGAIFGLNKHSYRTYPVNPMILENYLCCKNMGCEKIYEYSCFVKRS